MEPYRVICIFHFKSRRRSFKNLNPWPFQNFPREKVPYSFLYQDPWYTIIVYVNKSYSASSIKAQNLLPQFYMCGVATHSTKCAEVLLHAHVKESWLRNPRNFDLWNPKSEKKKVLLMDSAIMGFGIRNIVQRIRNLTDALTIESRFQFPLKRIHCMRVQNPWLSWIPSLQGRGTMEKPSSCKATPLWPCVWYNFNLRL